MNGKTTRRLFVKLAVAITVLYISIVSGCSQMNARLGFYHENGATCACQGPMGPL